jgi:acyl carrier protein
MASAEEKAPIFRAIASLAEDKALVVSEDTALIGDGSFLDSMKLVELCLLLEDEAAKQGFQFDWTSDSAMSRSRSMFRTAGSLADAFLAQRPARP